MDIVQFLDLGQQPISNYYPSEGQLGKETLYHLELGFVPELSMVRTLHPVPKETMFNDTYAYHSSGSQTMRDHFRKAAELWGPSEKVLEIGSNDGVFIQHRSENKTWAVEPCENFASLTASMGYLTYPDFWTVELAEKILRRHDWMDGVYSANCFNHIEDLDEALKAVSMVLRPGGYLVLEDPSLAQMLLNGSYDQIYDEHVWMFSVTGMQEMLRRHGLQLVRVDNLSVHGGSNRLYAVKNENCSGDVITHSSVPDNLAIEEYLKLHVLETYDLFAEKVEKSRDDLLDMLRIANEMAGSKNVISYGATAKSCTIFNYCGVTTNHIQFITDTTLAKQGKLSPGVHIPIVTPDYLDPRQIHSIFLGAWNYAEEIMEKEKDRLGHAYWITHVPFVRYL